MKIFEELEFRTLIPRVTGSAEDPLVGENNLGINVEPPKREQNQGTTDLDLEVDKVLKKMTQVGVLIDLKF